MLLNLGIIATDPADLPFCQDSVPADGGGGNIGEGRKTAETLGKEHQNGEDQDSGLLPR